MSPRVHRPTPTTDRYDHTSMGGRHRIARVEGRHHPSQRSTLFCQENINWVTYVSCGAPFNGEVHENLRELMTRKEKYFQTDRTTKEDILQWRERRKTLTRIPASASTHSARRKIVPDDSITIGLSLQLLAPCRPHVQMDVSGECASRSPTYQHPCLITIGSNSARVNSEIRHALHRPNKIGCN